MEKVKADFRSSGGSSVAVIPWTRRAVPLCSTAMESGGGSTSLHGAVLAIAVAASIIDRRVDTVSVVDRSIVAIPGLTVSVVTVWTHASRQACYQSKDYRQVFEHRGLPSLK
jgi:hypothetical protein